MPGDCNSDFIEQTFQVSYPTGYLDTEEICGSNYVELHLKIWKRLNMKILVVLKCFSCDAGGAGGQNHKEVLMYCVQ